MSWQSFYFIWKLVKLQLYKVAVTLQVLAKTDVTYEWKMYKLKICSIMFAMNWEMKYCPYITTKSKFTIKHQLQAITLTWHELMTITKNETCKEVTDFFFKIVYSCMRFYAWFSQIRSHIKRNCSNFRSFQSGEGETCPIPTSDVSCTDSI